jgi:sugar/nucleoside kinase (ribokinase family)
MFVVIGTANIDLIVSGFAQMPTVMGDEFTTSSLVFCDDPLRLLLGGNGANCAYVLAGLGAAVGLCSAVGVDELGRLVIDWLERQGVALAGLLRHPTQATAFTAIVSDQALNRLAFHHPGALAAYTVADIPHPWLAEAQVLLATGYTIMPGMRPAGFAQALATAHQLGAITALDIGPAIGQPTQLDELAPVLPHVDYLIANRHELAVCSGEAEVETGAARLFLPDGAQLVPAFPVLVDSTVGAGDAFNAGLLYACRQRLPLVEAVRFGNAVAALVISSGQGILGCPTPPQVAELLAQPSMR